MNKLALFTIILILYLGCNSLIYSTNKIPDSVTTKFNSIAEPSEKYLYLIDYSRANFATDSALSLATLKYGLATDLHDSLRIKFYHEIGIYYSRLREFEKAIPNFSKVLYEYGHLLNPILKGYAYRNLGLSYYNLSEFDSSLALYFLSLSMLDTTIESNRYYYALTSLDLGKQFFQMNNHHSNLIYTKIALKFFEESSDENNVAACYNNLGLSSIEIHADLSVLLGYFSKSLNIQKKLGNIREIGTVYNNISIAYMRSEQYDSALYYAQQSYKLISIIPEDKALTNVMVNLGRMFAEKDILDSAEYYTNRGLESAIKNTNLYAEEKAYYNLHLIYYKRKNFEKALSYHTKYTEFALNASQVNMESKIESIEKELHIIATQRELEFIKKEKEFSDKQNLLTEKINSLLIVGICILLILIVVLIFILKKFQNQKMLLKNQFAKIDFQNKELDLLIKNKNTLYSIIGHDLRGPIANLFVLLDFIPTIDDKLSEESKEVLMLTKNGLIQSWELLENLLDWARSENHDMNIQIKENIVYESVYSIELLFKSICKYKQINFTIEGDESLKAKFDKKSFETIVRNFIGNSVKFSDDNSNLQCKWIKQDNYVLLSIEDEAKGIPQHIIDEIMHFANSNDKVDIQTSQGLGLKLISELIRLNDITLIINRTEKGTRVELRMPC